MEHVVVGALYAHLEAKHNLVGVRSVLKDKVGHCGPIQVRIDHRAAANGCIAARVVLVVWIAWDQVLCRAGAQVHVGHREEVAINRRRGYVESESSAHYFSIFEWRIDPVNVWIGEGGITEE